MSIVEFHGIIINNYSDPTDTGNGDYDHDTCGVEESFYNDINPNNH